MEESSPTPTAEQREELFSEQVSLLYDQGPIGLLGTTLSAAFYSYIVWDILPHGALSAWLSLILVISCGRIYLEYSYKKNRPEIAEARKWGTYFSIGTLLSGITWGFAALFLFPEKSLPHQIFLAFLIGGLSTGTIATYTSLKWTSAFFSIPSMLLLCGKFFSMGGDIYYAIATIMLVFLLMMISTSLRIHATTLSSLKLRFSNLELLERVETEREWFRRLSEATFEGILVHDQGIIISANENAQNMFGYNLKEVAGKNALDFIVPEGRERAMKRIAEQSELPYETEGLKRDGTRIPVEIQGRAIPYKGKTLRIAAIHDLSGQKKAENSLRLSKEKAEKATKDKDQFISLLSHDLRSPLGAINGLADLLAKPEEHNLDNKNSTEISNRIKGMTEGLVKMIDRLLDISRLTIGTVKPVKKAHDLKTFAAVQIGHISYMSQNKEITISNEIPEKINIFFDDILFGEVLINVFSNAIKFSPRGGKISIRLHNDSAEGFITIAVEDNGVGISQSRLADIFKPEIKTNTLGTEGETGTGLGLPYCDEIMKAHKGNIRVESAQGKGSTFYIDLPVSKTVIVIVDDQEVQRDLLKTEILNNMNAEILEASNGIEALEVVKENLPDLLITDIEMPEMDGYELIKGLRNNSEFDRLPILVNSSLHAGSNNNNASGNSAREKALELGANDYSQKPFIPEELIKKINSLL